MSTPTEPTESHTIAITPEAQAAEAPMPFWRKLISQRYYAVFLLALVVFILFLIYVLFVFEVPVYLP